MMWYNSRYELLMGDLLVENGSSNAYHPCADQAWWLMLLVKEIVSILCYRIRDDIEFIDGNSNVDYLETLWDGWFDFAQDEDR